MNDAKAGKHVPMSFPNDRPQATHRVLPMTDRHIRAMLRGATAAKILNGWQGPHLLERSYCIAPCNASAAERPLHDVISYCEALATAGIQPLFRESEPLM
jgi:hypothetical protein